jgi:predicted secreted protein
MKSSTLAAAMLAAALTLTTAPPASAATQAVVLTNADDGRTIPLPVGKDITVSLTSVTSNGMKWSWSNVVSGNAHVLARSAGATAPNGGSKATFHAVEHGTVALHATATCVSCNEVKTWKITAEVK